MHSFLKGLRSIVDKLILSFCGVALIVLVITVTWQVFSRYVLNDPSSFTDELSRYVMIWLGLLGASYLFGVRGHLAITLLADSVPKQVNQVLQFAINALILTFVSLAMFKGGVALIGRTMQQFSPALQIPMGYVYCILPVSAVLITIYLLLNMLDSFYEK
ncbi:C4-dicarboxylate ABC transporter permease [Vibrio sp. 10N.286.49.C2]|uniref:TRAP transporter small permease n=1 Tax=unclassified Vibrio TaxID=2614977 RepID=UPI000C858685|nr:MULTISPECIES: TRAP transporter small permease [unclassified Vibrio]PMH33829.1 C4-dicarboxylate ABC transporter permease [Vibrio sp. 10N.286.49.C2]PMH44086.1 C4-dicarboxylate ABC transporter permease [Vibrio sp. 10N.286.49.B1]PMH82950.1 C4-dicarboxylate ABC transporter permease [Vibrio sp. 10N.286.48.B7]